VRHFTAAQLGQLIATKSLEPDSARLRIKNFVAKGYILTRQRSESDGRGTILFSAGDALVAAVLSQMVDLGGLSKEAMQSAATRLHCWHVNDGIDPSDTNTPESPAQWMWNEFTAAPTTPPGFTLHIAWQRRLAHVLCRASLSHGNAGDVGEGMKIPPDAEPLASMLVAIDPLFPELAARIDRMAKAH